MSDPKVIIGLENPKTPENIGSIMRAAGNYRVDRVIYTGKRYPRALMRNPGLPNLHRSVGKQVPLLEVSDLLEGMPADMKVVCVEFAEGATPLPQYRHPESALYLFGPEDGTLSKQVVSLADDVVYIPTIGCMNLAATVNVVLYDRLAKSGDAAGSEELIRQSRDANNRLKIKNNS